MTIEAAVRFEVEARVGTVLARKYRIERVLGIGGMGAVYAAAHRNGARVAIKVLHRSYAARGDVIERFLREGSLANRVGHPAVVRIVDDDVADDGCAFLVMELLRGATCRELADRRGGRMDLHEALVVTHRVLGALEAAHRARVVHRDIKPNNVFVTSAGEVKLLDFGIARLREGDALHDAATRTGMTLGTPGFMCPEQALGHTASIDARSDIWGTGAMLFNLLTGEHVHVGSTAQEIVVFTATRPARKLGEVLEVDPHIAAVVDRALALAPGDRYPSAMEMRLALESAYAAAFDARAPIAEATVVGPPSEREQLGHAPTVIASAEAGTPTIDPAGVASVAARTDSASRDAAGPFASITPPPESHAGGRPSRSGRVASALRLGAAGVAVLVGVSFGAAVLRREPSPPPDASRTDATALTSSPLRQAAGSAFVGAATAENAPRDLGPPSIPAPPAPPATTATTARADPPAIAPAPRKAPKSASGESAHGATHPNGATDAKLPPAPSNPQAPPSDALHDLDFR